MSESSQLDLRRPDAADEIFFHIARVRWDAYGNQLRPLARFHAFRNRLRIPAPRAPRRVALSRSVRAGTRGASRRASASSANMFRSGALARLSVPNATLTFIA